MYEFGITSGRINYAKLKREVILEVVGGLMDYRTSFSLKGKRLFYKKINDYLTKAR